MKPIFYAETVPGTNPLKHDVCVEWELKTLPGQTVKTRFFDKALIHHAASADEAVELVIALNDAVERILGK
jgi:hypothetical protein